MNKNLKQAALDYHRHPRPGKICVSPTKALTTKEELSLAYSPGVAAACEMIHENPETACDLTTRGNLVAVISNGTAVLGLGDIGPLASKPVMEGKGVLFKKFADIDVFDMEIDETDPAKLTEIISALEPTFGGINLEDIRAPECFQVEAALRNRLNIPVFHDDQHGTAIIAAAAVINALKIIGKEIGDIRLTASGAGAAGIACLDLLVQLGMSRENITVTDSRGVIYRGRDENMESHKAAYARDTAIRTLQQAMRGADVFLGLSVGGLLSQEMVKSMARDPIILALANPDPEIRPEDALAVRPDAIIATGRSDYPNQVNNVLGFPYIFRGALDVGATTINDEMKIACVNALAELTEKEIPQDDSITGDQDSLSFGPNYIIPGPFDQRLLVHLAPATAQAAMDSGVATRPIEDMEAYRAKLDAFVFRSGMFMRPVFDCARRDPARVVYADGEQPVVLRGVQSVVDNGLAYPILIGRPAVVQQRIEKLGLRLRSGEDFEWVDPQDDPRFREYSATYHSIMERRGVTPDSASAIVRTRNSVIAALMVHRDEADALISGAVGSYREKLKSVIDVIGRRSDVGVLAAMGILSTPDGPCFVCDTHVNPRPSAEEIAEIAMMAAEQVRIFGIRPRVALLSHSSFGRYDDKSSKKMRRALEMIRQRAPDLEAEGEMTADMALDEEYRKRQFPNSRLQGPANLLIAPDLNAAHIAFGLARAISKSVAVGPVLLGAKRPVHIVTDTVTPRRIMNMTAIAVVDAQAYRNGLNQQKRTPGATG